MRNIIKKCSVILIIGIMLLQSGCGKNDKQFKDTVSMYDLRTSMLEACKDFPDMLCVSDEDDKAEDNFSYVSDMEYDKVEHYFLGYSKEGKADEIVVLALNSGDDVDDAKKTLEDHRDSRVKLLEQYEPEETARVKDAMIFTEQQYAVMIISNDNDAVKKAFMDMVK